MTFVVQFWNPGLQRWVDSDWETREEAQARVDHYERKYGRFEHYSPAVIREEAEQDG